MTNYQIKIEYVGTNFVGWQFQKNGISIQEKIERALKKIFKTKTKIFGAGRTDKGVHANGQYANFKVKNNIINTQKFLGTLNFYLNNDLISVTDIKIKNLNFHSRFLAKERVYNYYIINRQSLLSLDKNRAWHIKKKIDLNILKKGGKLLEGTHDFSAFRSSSCTAKSPVRKINSVKVSKNGEKIKITFKSKSFLQNQVRSMVGCLVKLSCNDWTFKEFKSVLKSKKRSKCAPPAPAHGLFLFDVKY
tara:strand:+ start:1023 stop:1763 length:741 start_codon:yes stop_codon:yes gene_type:complete